MKFTGVTNYGAKKITLQVIKAIYSNIVEDYGYSRS